MLKFKSLLVVLISLAFIATACDKNEEETGAEEAPAVEKKADEEKADDEEAGEEQAGDEKAVEEGQGEELAMVDVPKEGKEFDPAVEKEQIPAGAWFCDMGTVEYASMEKGDGSCPECGMKLKQKDGEAPKAAAGEGNADDHAGHNH
jgi:hypothetical protein